MELKTSGKLTSGTVYVTPYVGSGFGAKYSTSPLETGEVATPDIFGELKTAYADFGRPRPVLPSFSAIDQSNWSFKANGGELFLRFYYYDRYHIVKHVTGPLLADCYPFQSLAPLTASYHPAEKNALSAAIADAGRTPFDAGQFLAELRETLSYLLSLLRDLQMRMFWGFDASDLKYLRSRWNSPSKAMDRLTSRWLEIRYGVIPLILDIESLIESLLQGFKQTGKFYRSKSSIKLNSDSTSNKAWRGSRTGLYALFYERTVETTEKVNATVIYRLNSFLPLTQLGLSAADLPRLLWERQALSFVVDWWLGIGDWLKSLQPRSDLVLQAYCTSHSIKREHTASAKKGALNMYGTYAGPLERGGCKASLTEKVYSRHILTEEAVLPRLDLGYSSWKHVLDAISLLWGRK